MTSQSVPVSLRLPEDLYLYLKRLARKEAVLRDRDTSLATLVRETLAEQYPVPADDATTIPDGAEDTDTLASGLNDQRGELQEEI